MVESPLWTPMNPLAETSRILEEALHSIISIIYNLWKHNVASFSLHCDFVLSCLQVFTEVPTTLFSPNPCSQPTTSQGTMVPIHDSEAQAVAP